MNIKSKICPKCKTEKLITSFSKDAGCKSGFRSWCKKCCYKSFERWRATHPVSKKRYAQIIKWRTENVDKVLATRRKYTRKRRSTLCGNLEARMAWALGFCLRKNKAGRSWESLVGYSVWDLQVHLQSKFAPGMTWERFLKGEIHIDHIIPKSRFHYETPEDPEFKVCWGLSNLQPLWAKDNLLKGAKIAEQNQ